MKIAFVFNRGRLKRLEKAHAGECPSEFFYGAIELEQWGHEIGYFEVDLSWQPGIVGGFINTLGHKGLMPEKLTGAALIKARDLFDRIRAYEVVVGTTSGIGYALACWKKLGYRLPRLITIHCGLLNNSYSPFRRYFSSLLLSTMQTVLFGDAELPPMNDLFPGVRGKMRTVQFGVDRRYWTPAYPPHRDYVLSVGNDGRRDFNTLIDAVQDCHQPVKILTKLKIGKELPAHIDLVRSSWHSEVITDADLRELYRHAKCVVVSLHESYQPSGQSVALQAMACGCPVILSDTKGLWSRKIMVDNQNVLLVKPGNAEELKGAVRRIQDDEKLAQRISAGGRRTVEKTLNTEEFARGIEQICREAVQNGR